jgi:hypothetical protein
LFVAVAISQKQWWVYHNNSSIMMDHFSLLKMIETYNKANPSLSIRSGKKQMS